MLPTIVGRSAEGSGMLPTIVGRSAGGLGMLPTIVGKSAEGSGVFPTIVGKSAEGSGVFPTIVGCLLLRKVSIIGGFANISAEKIGFRKRIFCFAIGFSGKTESAGFREEFLRIHKAECCVLSLLENYIPMPVP